MDFVEMVPRLAAFAIREEDSLRVVVNYRVADAALLVFKDRGDGPGRQMEPAQLAAVAVGQPGLAVGIVAEVGVPMFVLARLPQGKDDLLNAVVGDEP